MASSRTKPDAPADALAGPAPKRGQCRAKTTTGARCKRRALEGALVCAAHIGSRRRGRPTKLEPQTVDRICDILRAGGYLKVAVAAAGIGTSTFHEWMERGDPEGTKKIDQPFREFRARVEQSRAEGETRNVTLVATAAAKDWKAAAWLLERQFPDRWAGPRGRLTDSSIHPDDFANGEPSSGPDVVDDQVGPDGRPL
jgi:hypothetical protein